MAEEVTIILRTEVEGTEEVEQYRGEMAKVQQTSDKATQSANKAGKALSASTANFSKINQYLAKISPTLGQITQGINRMTASWKRYETQAQKASKAGPT